ncbi:Acyl-CoA dehydrogenase family member 11 [Bagarius yarrelli]|uniref:Acyl-CoA dehydrogenase family member 11 n=1 Tax=Bagarius yarrelli TaxID=175774 RepID=A0A556VV88_BAGYA|nr:Acyl-CoA dehydrogenase family member 11 [Bagarius yarrelli]
MDDDTTHARKQHIFHVKKLHNYLTERLECVVQDTPISVRQYRCGQSNPTFLIQTPKKSFVLRKKPHGSLLHGAHKVDREYVVQKALHAIDFPVPQPLLYCSDTTVIGTEFYIMEHVQGRIFRDPRLPGISAAERSALYVAAVEVLARLHSVDLTTLGLVGYGKGAGYIKRQVSTWTKQYRASASRNIPAVNDLLKWLSNNLPPTDDQVTLVHGDFRLDNLIFHPLEARVVAVLDWELSTIGQPLADLAYFLMAHYCPLHLNKTTVFGGITGIEGIPSAKDIVTIYCQCREIPPSLPHENFFVAFAMFKMACIAQGIYARSLLGNASSPNAAQFNESVEPLAQLALKIARSSSLDVQVPERLFLQSAKGYTVLQQVKEFMKQHIMPAQKELTVYYVEHCDGPERWQTPPVLEKLKHVRLGFGICSCLQKVDCLSWSIPTLLKKLDDASMPLRYSTARLQRLSAVTSNQMFDCDTDSGNIEVLHLFGTEEQKKLWLEPLLQGDIRSCFCMTEPDIASSDATNMECTLHKDKDHYVINGKKWWSSGAGHPKCKIAIVMCKNKTSDGIERHNQHSMILVPLDAHGVRKIRHLTVFGQDDAWHGGHFEINFDNVRVPVANILLGEGRGFEIAQGRLGPGRLHHCMRAVGLAEHALELLCQRSGSRSTFGKRLYQHEVIAHWIAECRIAIEQVRLLALHAAFTLDTQGNKAARKQIAVLKVAASRMACKVVDCAIQVHGGAGVSDDFPLARMYTYARTLRLADGPDEVHLSSIAQMEIVDQLRQKASKL